MTPTTPVEPRQSPYRGILPFRYEDRAFFFGREQEVNQLKARMLLYRLVVLFGESGAGKSSVLNAGIVPSLLDEGFQPERLRVRPFEDEPILVERISAGDQEGRFLPSIFTSAEDASGPERGACCSLEWVRQKVRQSARVPPVLIFDQFEELFTLFETGHRATQARILDLLDELVNDKGLAAKVVIAIREDFLGRLELLAKQFPQVFDRRVRLGLLSLDSARVAITGAFRPGHPFPSEVCADAAEAIVSGFVPGSAEPLIHSTQLQIVCSRLWDEWATKSKHITAREFAAMGGVQGILRGFLESEMERLPPNRRVHAYRLLGQLVTSSGTRDVVSEERLRGLLHEDEEKDQAAMKAILAFLDERRLINRTPQRSTYYYEVSSEYLIGPIREYNDACEREEAVRKAAIAAAEGEKEAAQERELEQARLLAEAEKEAAKRLRYGLGVLAVALLVTLFAAYSAVSDREVARKAVAQLSKAVLLNDMHLQVFRSNVQVKQEALSGDPALVARALRGSPSRVRFRVNAIPRGYSGPSGPVYSFELTPLGESIDGGYDALALVTYKLDHPTFRNSTFAAGPDRGFTASYDGWGCLSRVIAILEYRDPGRHTEATQFDMCELWRRSMPPPP